LVKVRGLTPVKRDITVLCFLSSLARPLDITVCFLSSLARITNFCCLSSLALSLSLSPLILHVLSPLILAPLNLSSLALILPLILSPLLVLPVRVGVGEHKLD
jgi:hypothetical protein